LRDCSASGCDTISDRARRWRPSARCWPRLFAAKADITEENIQSRARGMTLMALSNKFGHMVLSTGNKIEMSVGYATLYGDMCGGYSVLKDVYKTTCSRSAAGATRTARWRLGPRAVMPERVITKPPTAELKPDQTDQDTLPPYDVLDDILRPGRERDAHRGHRGARLRRGVRCAASGACSTAPSTSAARRRPA
jgi:NAD+ synthase